VKISITSGMSSDASLAAAPLPDDLETCQRELQHTRVTLAETAVLCEDQGEEIQSLRAELELLKRYIYGRRSERAVDSPGQGRLFSDAEAEESDDASCETAEEEITCRRRRRGHGWSKLPEHLPREEVHVDVPEAERQCPCCGETMAPIGEDRSERVDFRPAKIVVKVIVRPKYACSKKHGGVQQAPPPPSPVPGGRFDFGFVAQVLTSKFADHLPLYRQQDVLARSGLELSRSTLCDIVAGSAGTLTPLAELLGERVLSRDLLGADDTPVRALDPAHPEGVRTARFWLYYGYEAPYDVFQFHESRSRDGPQEFLQSFSGWAKVDAYGVQDGVYLKSGGRIRASCCFAHARRKFFEARSSHPRKSAEAVGMIRQLYDVEDQARELPPELRLELRQRESWPVLERLKTWLGAHADALPKSKFGEAVRYARNQWEELTSYVLDGRLPIDNNDTEGELRRLTIGRKNWLFLGAPEAGPRAAIIYTVVASAARHDLELWAYLCDVLEQLATGADDLTPLLPDEWAKTHPEHIRAYRGREREAKAARQREIRRRRRLLGRSHPTG